MNQSAVQYDLRSGVWIGETAGYYSANVCNFEGITRYFVIDIANHLIAMCSLHHDTSYISNYTPFPLEKHFKEIYSSLGVRQFDLGGPWVLLLEAFSKGRAGISCARGTLLIVPVWLW